jgi:hypothetical protein
MKICTACKTENNDTRVFCLNCRERLPAPLLGSAPGLPETIAQVPEPRFSFTVSKKKQIPKKSPNARRNYAGLFLSLVFWAVLAGLVWAIYLVAHPPFSIQPPVERDAAAASSLAAFFKKASTTPAGAWMGSEDAINRFLLENVRLVPLASRIGLHTEFNRCFVKLHQGRLDFVMQQSLQGYPLYFTLLLEPYSEDGDLKVRLAGASFGRLPIPAPLAPFVIGLWQPCFDSLGAIVDRLDSASSASVAPNSLVVRWPGKSES